jgi:hypothetical protein
LLHEIPDGGRFSKRAAGAEMNYPIVESVIHHSGKLRKLNSISMEVDSPRAAVKSEVENPVVPFAKEVEVVPQLLAGITR